MGAGLRAAIKGHIQEWFGRQLATVAAVCDRRIIPHRGPENAQAPNARPRSRLARFDDPDHARAEPDEGVE